MLMGFRAATIPHGRHRFPASRFVDVPFLWVWWLNSSHRRTTANAKRLWSSHDHPGEVRFAVWWRVCCNDSPKKNAEDRNQTKRGTGVTRFWDTSESFSCVPGLETCLANQISRDYCTQNAPGITPEHESDRAKKRFWDRTPKRFYDPRRWIGVQRCGAIDDGNYLLWIGQLQFCGKKRQRPKLCRVVSDGFFSRDGTISLRF